MDSHLEKYSWISPSSSPYTKINFRFDQYLNIINKNLKMLEENIEFFFNMFEVRISLLSRISELIKDKI